MWKSHFNNVFDRWYVWLDKSTGYSIICEDEVLGNARGPEGVSATEVGPDGADAYGWYWETEPVDVIRELNKKLPHGGIVAMKYAGPKLRLIRGGKT